ncbi:hypothetical protein [Desulfocapsa sulfexigens]|nr:hypothetical protein [Desulfocapsa sulfexigens]
MTSQGFYKQLYDLGVYWDRELNIQRDCNSKYYVNPISHAILTPLTFNNEDVYPVGGVWTFRYEFKRCNKSKIYNAIVVAKNGKEPQMGMLVPGTTYCSPLLIRDLFVGGVAGMVAIKRKDESCKTIKVLDTKVTKGPDITDSAGKEHPGMWEEQWIVKSCNETITMTFCFVPDGNNGTNWSSGKCKI